MGNLKIIAKLLLIAAFYSISGAEGFYADVFMDGGVDLYSHDYFYAADSLGLDWEFMATESNSIQDELIEGTALDANGILLYPDGQPRYRTIYTNGGSATGHGNSMGETGRQRVRDFFAEGGSYTGSCAGAFITSLHYNTSGIWTPYYHIWPGRTGSTGLIDTPTGHFIEEDCPLLDYFDFGGDLYIDQVYHTGGCYAREELDWPSLTEPLLRFDYPARSVMHEAVSCWAYKEDTLTGRLVVIGSHPENYETGERLHLMMSMLLYALDGNGNTRIKGNLENGISREMTAPTADDNPDFTVIGDLQYHHFTITVPDGVSVLSIEIAGEPGFDLHIFAGQGGPQFHPDADYMDISTGSTKTLNIPSPTPGVWYIAVKCANTVTRELQSWGYDYIAGTDVLNGVAYSITATWDTSSQITEHRPDRKSLSIAANPFNASLRIEANMGETVRIFSQSGRMVTEFLMEKENHIWNAIDAKGRACPSGIYIVTTETQSKKATLIR